MLLDAAIEAGQGGACSIVCTQPRRIAAISVAERVASERGEPAPGQPGSLVGYACPAWLLHVWVYCWLHSLAETPCPLQALKTALMLFAGTTCGWTQPAPGPQSCCSAPPASCCAGWLQILSSLQSPMSLWMRYTQSPMCHKQPICLSVYTRTAGEKEAVSHASRQPILSTMTVLSACHSPVVMDLESPNTSLYCEEDFCSSVVMSVAIRPAGA